MKVALCMVMMAVFGSACASCKQQEQTIQRQHQEIVKLSKALKAATSTIQKAGNKHDEDLKLAKTLAQKFERQRALNQGLMSEREGLYRKAEKFANDLTASLEQYKELKEQFESLFMEAEVQKHLGKEMREQLKQISNFIETSKIQWADIPDSVRQILSKFATISRK